VNIGLVDNPDRAFAAGRRFRQEDVDLIVLHVTTYALSSTVLPVVLRAKVPVLVLNLAPAPAIDSAAFNALGDRTRMTGDWLAHCSACPVPEIANIFRRAGVHFHQVTGVIHDDPVCWREIDDWVDAARVAASMYGNRLGLMGHYYSGMLDIQSAVTLQCSTFGTHAEHLEVNELSAMRREVEPAEIDARLDEFHVAFDVQSDCPENDLAEAARPSVASIILGTSLLTARGVPVAGEYEVKNAQAMEIMDLFGAGGSFTEFYEMDFNEGIALMGHDGPGHVAIAQGKPRVRPLRVYHGKVDAAYPSRWRFGTARSHCCPSSRRPGGKLALLCAESVPGSILEIGNTNSRYRFPCGAREFVQRWNSHGPAHHCAAVVGHLAIKLEKLGLLLGLGVIRVG